MHPYEDPETPETPNPDAVVETPAQPETPVAETRDFYDVVAESVWNDEDPVTDDTLKGFTADAIKAFSPEARMALAGLIKRDKDRTAAQEAERAKFAEEQTAAKAALDAREADIKRQQLAYSAAVADPAVIDKLRERVAKKPAVVNPADPASIEALIDAKAAEKVLEAMGPAAQRHDQLARENSANATFSAVGLNRDNAEDKAAVNAKMRELYGREGMDAESFKAHIATLSQSARQTGGRSPTEVAVALVAAERKTRADADRRADETASRMAGARALSTGAPRQVVQPTDQQYVDARLKEIGDSGEAFAEEYANNQKFREAVTRLQA